MTPFSFTCRGKTVLVQDTNKLKAMGQANDMFVLGSGAWMDRGPQIFVWVEGNFFD